MRIQRENSLAILVDVQEKLLPVINDKDELLKNIMKLIKGLNVLQVPILESKQYTKGLGETVPPIKELLIEGTPSFDKISFSCYDDTSIKQYIMEQGKTFIILFGMEAHICLLQTAIDCMEVGYQVIVVVDCIGSRKDSDKQIAIKRLEKEGVIITTLESLLFELTRYAGTEIFKEISKIIK